MTLKLMTLPDLEAETRAVLAALAGADTPVERAPPPDGDQPVAALHDAVAAGSADLALVRRRLSGDGLATVAVLARSEPHDVLIGPGDGPATLERLPSGAHVGLRGPRRLGLLKAHRPDLHALPLTNGHTPESALESGAADALILGASEARRLGLAERTTELLDPRAWVPAPGQGTVLIVARGDDTRAARAVSSLDDLFSHRSWRSEIALTAAMGAGVDGPLGAVAMPFGRWIRLWGMVTAADGSRVVRADLTGSIDDPEGLGTAVADLLLMRGAGSILAGGAP